MTEYETFMVYELDDSGEKVKLEVNEEDLQANLHPEQVLVIIKEDLRRIFIWKGPKSPVRKRFISSRVASGLQEELVKAAHFHRCKIVSVDAGDEPTEFLRAFNLESMEVTERTADMRYVRNIEREGLIQQGVVVETKKSKPSAQVEEEYFSPALQETGQKVVASSFTETAPRSRTQPRTTSYPVKQQSGLSNEKIEKIKEKILKTELSAGYQRLNLIVGHTLFAAVSKTAKIFGKDVVETDWEPVKKVPEGMIELEDHVLRVYFDEKNGIVEAVEVLEKGESSNTKAPQKKAPAKKAPAKKAPAKKTAPKKKSSLTPMPDKPNSLKSETKPKSGGRRQLPKIPSNDE